MLESLKTLCGSLGSDRPQQCPIVTDSGSLSWSDIGEMVAVREEQLRDIAERLVLVRSQRGDDLLASLFAIWRQGKVAVLSNRPLPEVEDASALVDAAPLTGFAADLKCTADTAVVLYTSGSSGEPAAVGKTFAQLDAELAMLEARWGDQVEGSVFVAAVSWQHMYGLPFALLWPVARGGTCYAKMMYYTQTLEGLAERFIMTLIASPVHLSNLPGNLNWRDIQANLRSIFSAGAPLPEHAAELCRRRLVPVTEIYGSTESGAIAWRNLAQSKHWQCLPGVEVAVAEDSQLQIRSPCMTAGDNDWSTLADRAQLHSNNTFELLGRVDRIVKIGGKRVSLVAVENALASHPWVADVRALALAERKGRLGVVVALHAEGRAELIDKGRQVVNRLLAKHVRQRVDDIAIPRYWRYLPRLPVDAQGKTSTALLKTLFFSEQQPRLPELLDRQRSVSGNEERLTLRMPYNLYYFAGHFPGNPVLPGVTQISWVQHYGRGAFAIDSSFLRLESLKFQHIVQPGDIVTLLLNWDDERHRLTFSYSCSEKKNASGRMLFSPGSEGGNGK